MFGVLDWVKVAVGVLAGVAIGYMWGHWDGKASGYDKRIAEMAANDARAEMERKGDDTKLRSMSDYDLCVAGLGAQRLPIDACEQLRGLREE